MTYGQFKIDSHFADLELLKTDPFCLIFLTLGRSQ